MPTAALDIVYEPLSALARHEANPKEHDVDLIRAAIRRHGFIDPLVVDERTGKLAAGHGRLAALEGMAADGEDPPRGVEIAKGGEWRVPRVKGYASANDEEAAAALVALNRTTEAGGWDDHALVALLENLRALEDGLDGVGYTEDEIDDLRARLGDWAPDFDPVGDDEQPRLDQRDPIVCGACGATVDPKTGEPRGDD